MREVSTISITRKTDFVRISYLLVGVCTSFRLSFSFAPINSNFRMSIENPRKSSSDGHNTVSIGNFGSTSLSSLTWHSLDPFVAETLDPLTLCTANEDHPRLAKDTEYATAVLKVWRDNISSYPSFANPVGCNFLYRGSELKGSSNGEMNGYLVAPSSLVELETSGRMKKKEQVPAVVLFHTGAGPQDIFLRWKADILVRELGCVVLIADIISDADGYAWTDRDRYDAARKRVLATSEEGGRSARWELRRVITAAINHLKDLDFVQSNSIAALGWCFGGNPILELGLMQEECVRALISYHGVFDGVKEYEVCTTGTSNESNATSGIDKAATRTQVLICNGQDDPFVQQDDTKLAKDLLEMKGCDVSVFNFDGVKHGFTNPAQDYNPSDMFAFNEHAAKKSWDLTIQLLRQTLCA